MNKFTQKQILLFGISLAFMTGCLQKYIIDDVQLIQGVVYDTAKDKIKTSIVCPIQEKGHKVQVFENIGNTVKQGRKSFFRICTIVCQWTITCCSFTEKLAKKI